MPPSLIAPMRTHQWRNGPVVLEADNSCWYTLELLTKRSLFDAVREALDPDRETLNALWLMLWALTTSWRDREKISFPWTAEDRELGAMVPRSFVRTIPVGAALEEVEISLLDLLVECGLAGNVAGGAIAGPPAEPPPEPSLSTGDGGSISQQPSSD